MDKKMKNFEQKFLQFQHGMLENFGKQRDLDKAMGDTDSAVKEQIKIDMCTLGIEIFEQAKQKGSLEDVTNSFMNRLGEEKGRLELRIAQAREQENTQEMIENQIRIGVLKGPVEGFFKACLKQV